MKLLHVQERILESRVAGVLKIHEELAEESELVLGGLTVNLFWIFQLPKLLRREENRLFSTFLPSAFLGLYTFGTILFLINTAHAGGRLVHEFGVHAHLPESHDDSPATPEAQAETNTQLLPPEPAGRIWRTILA